MKFDIRIKINQSAKEVFQSMLSTQLLIKWETNFSGFNPIKGGKRKLGSTAYRIYNEADGTTTKIKEEVTEIESGKLFAYQLTDKNFISYVTCKIVDKGDYILLVEKTDIKFRPAILGIFGLLMKGSMKKRREADLLVFKELIESK